MPETKIPGIFRQFCNCTLSREEGVRTLDRVTPIPAFQAGPFNHSGTSLLDGKSNVKTGNTQSYKVYVLHYLRYDEKSVRTSSSCGWF